MYFFLLDASISNALNTTNDTQITSVFELMMKGGVVMYPIFILSIIAFYIFGEKLYFIVKNSKFEKGFAKKVASEISNNNIDGARQVCKNNKAIGRIFNDGIDFVGQPFKEIESVIESSANVEVSRMEKNISYLGIIAGIAPMLGFIGTIIGVIHIFYNISMTDNISIGIIAGGLYQKMVASGTGLVVGVIAYSFYHYLNIEIDKFSARLQQENLDFFKSLKK
jgi:biopolymer transport protein ExbB